MVYDTCKMSLNKVIKTWVFVRGDAGDLIRPDELV